jgi:hypothetical protein
MASGSGGAWAVVLMGGTFHLGGVALLLGLNVFPCAFGATVPAVLLRGSWVDGWWAGWR